MVLWLEKTCVMNFTNSLKLLLGGKIGFRGKVRIKGAYYPAAILADLEPGMEGLWMSCLDLWRLFERDDAHAFN
jgi:hypothetical protein